MAETVFIQFVTTIWHYIFVSATTLDTTNTLILRRNVEFPCLALFWLARFNETTKYDQHVRAEYSKACRVRIYYSPSPFHSIYAINYNCTSTAVEHAGTHVLCTWLSLDGPLWSGWMWCILLAPNTQLSGNSMSGLVELVVIERAILCVHV